MPSLSWRAVFLLVAIVILLAPAPASAQFGRTEGGFGGAALGAMGGSAAGSALVAAAGIANPLLGGAMLATTTLAGTYAGAKLGSRAGNTLDQRVDKRVIWDAVGGVTGALAGFAFGPGAGMIGKVIGASVGAALGAWAGNHFAPKANTDLNPRTAGALIGGVNGALLGGPVGAAVGVPLGYIGGDLLDSQVFSNGTFNLGQGSANPPAAQGAATGRDREGFDALGYDARGFDREGYDRFGYDKRGLDRNGYNRAGFGSATPKPSQTYDPKVYGDFWQAWRQTGGAKPEFEDEHWKLFPKATTASGAAAPSSTLVTLKQDYMKAVEDMQKAAGTGTDAEKAATLTRVKTCESALNAKAQEEGITH